MDLRSALIFLLEVAGDFFLAYSYSLKSPNLCRVTPDAMKKIKRKHSSLLTLCCHIMKGVSIIASSQQLRQ